MDHYLNLGILILLWCFFAHLVILEYPDHHQNLISSSLYYLGPFHKISSHSVYNFLSNVVHRQTNKQTDRHTIQRYQKHNLLCQGGNECRALVKGLTCTSIKACHNYYEFFAHLLIKEDPDCHQNLISSSLYYPRPLQKISLEYIHNFLSNVAYKQTN